MVEVCRYGEVLAMKAQSPDGCWLQLRDVEDDGDLVEMWVLVDAEPLGLGVLLEPLPGPPPEELRTAHARVVQERLRAHARVHIAVDGQENATAALHLTCTAMAEGEDTLQRLQLAQQRAFTHGAFATGVITEPYASDAARIFLLQRQRQGRGALTDPSAYRDFEQRFLREGYVVLDGALTAGERQQLVEEMARLDGMGALRPAPQQVLGQRGDRVLWLDEALAQQRYAVPAVVGT